MRIKLLSIGAASMIALAACAPSDDAEDVEEPTEELVEEAEELEEEEESVEKEAEEEQEEVETPEKEPDEAKNESVSLSEENALGAAKSYLEYTAFSEQGLKEQLAFEGYEDGDIEYAISQLDVDWSEQAVKAAEQYLDYSDFSKSRLIEQLEFEGYSTEDAEYAVEQVGF